MGEVVEGLVLVLLQEGEGELEVGGGAHGGQDGLGEGEGHAADRGRHGGQGLNWGEGVRAGG